VPFIMLCSLVERLLAELARVTPGFAARVAVARARAALDPEHQSLTHQLGALRSGAW
jgi:hypothetical protein